MSTASIAEDLNLITVGHGSDCVTIKRDEVITPEISAAIQALVCKYAEIAPPTTNQFMLDQAAKRLQNTEEYRKLTELKRTAVEAVLGDESSMYETEIGRNTVIAYNRAFTDAISQKALTTGI